MLVKGIPCFLPYWWVLRAGNSPCRKGSWKLARFLALIRCISGIYSRWGLLWKWLSNRSIVLRMSSGKPSRRCLRSRRSGWLRNVFPWCSRSSTIRVSGRAPVRPAVSLFLHIHFFLLPITKWFFSLFFTGHIELNGAEDSVIEFNIAPIKTGSAVFPTLRLFHLRNEGKNGHVLHFSRLLLSFWHYFNSSRSMPFSFIFSFNLFVWL